MTFGLQNRDLLERKLFRRSSKSKEKFSGRFRRKATIVMSSATAQATQPLTKQDLAAYIASGCKPRQQWRIGTEHEKLGYYKNTKKRITWDTIRQLLEGLCQRHGWEPIMEGKYIIGCEKDGQSVTIEPGGQFELSGAPVTTLHETLDETKTHLEQVNVFASELGVSFLNIGFDPKWRYEDVPIMPKNRYRVMRDYMPNVGTLGHDMMFRSTTIQVNMDFENEQDMVEKVRIGLALQPVATALFSNSPFKEGKDTGFLSWRSHVWEDVDSDRCGILPFVWEDGFGFDRYTEYALDVPMYFAYRDGNYLDATKARATFREFMDGKLSILPGETPTLKDWETHLTTIFPEVRLKRYLEMRGGDGGPLRNIVALSAFWIGLLYNKKTQKEAYDMIMTWTMEEHIQLRAEVPKSGLKTPFRDGTIQDIAKQALQWSRQGLKERGFDEEKYLEPLLEIAETGKPEAAKLLDRYYNEWNESVDPIYSPEYNH